MLRDILLRHINELFIDYDEDSDSVDFNEEIDKILTRVEDIINIAEKLPPDDPKFHALIKIINDKQKNEKNKLMIFSSFRHILRYLNEKLVSEGLRVGLIHGDIPDEERRELRRRFEMKKTKLRLLIFFYFQKLVVKVFDYQFCDCMVNYDLPWNPMKIEQRIGRIDRNGQKSENVTIFNMFTPGTVDYDIYDRCTSRIGVFKQSIGDCEEILGSLSSDIQSIVNNFSMDDNDRKQKLQQVTDNKIRLIQEQLQLEEKQKDLFGIRVPESVFRQEVEDANNYWLTPSALLNMVRLYLKKRINSDKECIVGEKSLKDLRLSQNTRAVLLEDFKNCNFSKNSENRMWEKLLKSGEVHIPVTFDTESSKEDSSIVLITTSHPLVKQAAKFLKK